jgi:hypothetical protein
MYKNGGKCLENGLDVTVARSKDDIEALRPIWEQIQANESCPNIDADIDRYLSVVGFIKEAVRPHVVLLCKNGNPKIMAIGRVQITRLPCKIGYKTVLSPSLKCLFIVYGGLIGELTDENVSILLRELLQTLANREVDVVFFNHLKVNSSVYHLARTTPNFLCRSHFQNFQNHWQTLIPGSSEGLDKIISKKHQRDIQRYIRNLEKTYSCSVKFVCYRKKEDIQEFMDIASRISISTYQGEMGFGFFADPLKESLLRQAQEDGWLRAYVLYAGTNPVAFEYGCVQGDVYFAEEAGYDLRWKAYSPGTILQLKIFESLSRDDKVVKYDYGLGDAAYKQRFGSVSWPEVSLYIFAPRLYPIVINLLDSSIRGISISMAYLVERMGLTGKIKRWWRRRLSTVSTEQPP